METRRAKQEVDADRLREQWRARAAEHGLDAPALEQLLRPGDRAVGFPRAVAPEALTREASVFGRAELLQALAQAQPRGARITELELLADGTLAARELVALPHGPVAAGLSEPRFTTAEMLSVEQDLIDHATSSLGAQRGRVADAAVQNALRDRSLSAEQEHVVRELCGRGDGVSVLRAPAGTGKTFVLDAARQAWQSSRREVLGCSLSARAALELHDQTAICAVTIAQLTGRLDDGERLPRGGVLVVDEAGMVGTRDLARLAQAAQQARGKLVLVGDDRQLPEIEAGGAFRALAEHLPACELREVRRQRHAWDRQALDALRSGEVERWARAYRDHGKITVGHSAQATRAALVNDWARADGDRLMIAARRDDVADLNQRARQLLQDQGRLGPDELTVAGRGFTTGDRVVGARNDRLAGLLNGQRATITATHPDQRTIDLRLDNGTTRTVGPDYLQAGYLDHGYAITAHRAQGATVDRTFVLGGEELYREWGYTALSRHKHEARFYVTGSDLHADREQPSPHDPLVAGLTRLLQRSQAKELALESLPLDQREQLEQERRQLRAHLTRQPPPFRLTPQEDRELDAATAKLKRALDDKKALLERGEQLRRRDRRARADLDARFEHNHEHQHHHAEEIKQLLATRKTADLTDHAWLTTHQPDAARLLTIEAELHARDTATHRAATRIQNLDRDPPDRALEHPAQDHNLDLDLGR